MKDKSKSPALLIVDDEIEILYLLKEIIEPRGYEVITTNSAEQALHLAASRQFSVILADLKMPGLEGIEIVEKLKPLCPMEKIIVMSGYGSQVVDSLDEIGVRNYIVKPINFDQLFEKIDAIVSK